MESLNVPLSWIRPLFSSKNFKILNKHARVAKNQKKQGLIHWQAVSLLFIFLLRIKKTDKRGIGMCRNVVGIHRDEKKERVRSFSRC
jgi:hypothetical protein